MFVLLTALATWNECLHHGGWLVGRTACKSTSAASSNSLLSLHSPPILELPLNVPPSRTLLPQLVISPGYQSRHPTSHNHPCPSAARLSPPLGSLDADHPHVLRVVYELAAEALVLKNRSNVVPVVLRHAATDGQVVSVTWSKGRR